MGLIARKYNVKNVKFNNIQGSGLFSVSAICKLSKCTPRSLPTPSSPVPQTLFRSAPKPLIATKQSSKDNKWSLRGTNYPDFNSLWVNIPKGSYITLKTNG